MRRKVPVSGCDRSPGNARAKLARMSTRRGFFSLLFAPPAQIIVGEHKAVTVRFRQMDRATMINLIGDIMTPGEQGGLKPILATAGDLTLIMTTERAQ